MLPVALKWPWGPTGQPVVTTAAYVLENQSDLVLWHKYVIIKSDITLERFQMSSIIQNSWKKQPFTYSLFLNSKSKHRSPPEKRLHVKPRKETVEKPWPLSLATPVSGDTEAPFGSGIVKFRNKQLNYF